ncbi:putative importin-beta domain, exportin-2, armadillo-like helical, exportin-2, central [Dioscorea sansibarensis]
MDFNNSVALETLSQWFLQSLSPSPEPRRAAESSLSAAADHPGFPIALLRLVAGSSIDQQICLAAAVHFKNLIRTRWSPSDTDHPMIPQPEKDQIKSLLLPLMLSSPSALVRSQLSESLSLIASHDFPQSWPSLLPDIVSTLRSSTDYSAINGLLAAANSIFLKFRHSFDTPALRLDLKYCLDLFAAPLLEIFLKTSSLISTTISGNGQPESLRPPFESQRLCCEIFLSLNAIDLPEFFEDHMREWMSEFLVYLTKVYPPALEADGSADALRAAVCENLQFYMEKNEEEFKDYLKDFASAVWNLLITPATSPFRDQLTITAIRFLTKVSTSVHHSLFSSSQALQEICQSIVFPNVRLRDEDEELFEMNYVEYIRRDIEGSDIDTRRRIACELLKGLALNYKEQVTALVSMQIQNMLALYAANPGENWKEKDSAIYLVVSLATKGSTGHLVDVDSFFATVIVPELQGQDVNASSMLKAGALKFFTTFREQIPKQASMALLPDVIRFLAAESNVVHSYAANCIEKLLLVKDKVPTPASGLTVVHSHARYGPSDIDPFLPSLLTNLFNALQFPDSQENQYVMRCIMRVVGVATVVGEAAAVCMARLAFVLGEVCKNPKNPIFNHYLFEAMAALIARSCEKDQSLISLFEGNLFPVLQNILVNDITEFWPYAFQIFAQLVETSKPPLSDSYMQLFQVLLSLESWKRSANVPALVRLLQAYLQKMPAELNREGRLSQVLAIFNKLVMSASTEELGFFVLNTVVENLGSDVLAPYIGHIWSALFTRLQIRRNVKKFVNSLIIFMSLVLVKHGPVVLVDSINAVQPNIFITILQQFWIPNLKLLSGVIEVKLASIASTRLLCESSSLLDTSAAELWGKLLDSIITLLAQPEEFRENVENEPPEVPETEGYSASFARLHNAGKKEEDPLKEIRDSKEFLVSSLARLSAASPGRYGTIIEKFVDPQNRSALIQLCGGYNCTIV